MARAGIFKWDVKDARDRLVREGRNPSIDAVRTALGDTGSKSTIHRYLKELEAEEAGSSKLAVSDALQTLVSQLAERLQHEAQADVEAATARFESERSALNAQLDAARQEGQRLRTQLERTELAIVDEKQSHAATTKQLQDERTRIVQLTEQGQGYEQRLAEHRSHQRSLEEKHEQARQALEHFRASAKEQREQEHRRHEQQVQQLQSEIRSLNGSLTEKRSQLAQINSSAAALTAEVGGLRIQLAESRSDRERLEKELAQARDVASRTESKRLELEGRLAELRTVESGLQQELAVSRDRARELEVAKARVEALLEAAADKATVMEVEVRRLQDTLARLRPATTASERSRTDSPASNIEEPTRGA